MEWSSDVCSSDLTGRNDFEQMKVARDAENVYFYAKTVDPVSPVEGKNWMQLFLDADGDPHNGWNGYDVRVSGSGDLEKYQDGAWKEAGTAEYTVDGEELMITIPRKLVAAFSGRLDFEDRKSTRLNSSH